MREIAGYTLLFTGAFFIVVSAIGLVRLPDVFTRMQAATKSTTLGAVCSIIGVGVLEPSWLVKTIVIALFILLTAPISGSALIRASYRSGSQLSSGTVVNKLSESEESEEVKK